MLERKTEHVLFSVYASVHVAPEFQRHLVVDIGNNLSVCLPSESVVVCDLDFYFDLCFPVWKLYRPLAFFGFYSPVIRPRKLQM
jgi:hypothetical protein